VSVTIHDLGGRAGAPPLLLSHATGFHGLVWRPFADALADHYRMWSWDARGHGTTPPPPDLDFGWAGFGDDVMTVLDALCDAVGGQRPFAAGHSMGGAALVMAEVARPGTFAALYLYEPILPPPDMVAGPSNFMAEAARRRRPSFPSRDAAVANYASKPPLGVFHPDALDAYVNPGFADQPDGTVALRCLPEWEARTFEATSGRSTWDRLGEVSCPVVVAAGGADMDGPSRFAQLASDRMPASRFECFEDLDHFGPLAQPERVAASAHAFFGTVGA
jgi:pimeloyl-ACP methyl ester carboxylesterase